MWETNERKDGDYDVSDILCDYWRGFGLWCELRIETRDEKFRAKTAEAGKLRATPLTNASSAS
jgi:hypothetical protein